MSKNEMRWWVGTCLVMSGFSMLTMIAAVIANDAIGAAVLGVTTVLMLLIGVGGLTSGDL